MNRVESAPTIPRRHVTYELLAAVAESFIASGYADLERVDCHAHGERVVLSGDVPSYRLKQVAQALAMRVAGAGRIDNRLRVDPPGEWRDADRRAAP